MNFSKKLLLCLLCAAPLAGVPTAVRAQTETRQAPVRSRSTIRQQMDELHRRLHLNFSYDASLPVDRAYHGPSLSGKDADEALRLLFGGSGMTFTRRHRHVIVRRMEAATPQTAAPSHHKAAAVRRHTVSGYVTDASGETLINATIHDLTTRQATVTNGYGYFSITLPEGDHCLQASYVGFAGSEKQLSLQKDERMNFVLTEDATLSEVVVEGNLNSPLLTTQTGRRTLSSADISTEYALLSSPDVVKTLQRSSGVGSGVELTSGLYVHGGGGDENLFLLDDTPLYQINHALGLFSSFNTDVVKHVDFYKSGFPARYGGRLSSVTDARTADGDFTKWHGNFRLGLLDGSLHVEGPIKPGRTSLNIGLRRSWLDALTRTLLPSLINDENEKMRLGYFFHDFNAKLTHIVNDRSRLSLSVYSGLDKLSTKDEYTQGQDLDVTRNNITWGNFNVALNWNYRLSPQLFANLTGIYTHMQSSMTYTNDYTTIGSDGRSDSHTFNQQAHKSTVTDLGYRTNFDFRPSPNHHLRFGQDFIFHQFRPQTRHLDFLSADFLQADTVQIASRNHNMAREITLYGEDEWQLGSRWMVNAGLHASLFGTGGKWFHGLDPRAAVKYELADGVALKASATHMTQYVHKISNAFIDLPTDYWVATTPRLRPMTAWQWAAGAYWQPSSKWQLSLEGYYKRMRHLLLYANTDGLAPAASSWDATVMDGRGRAYGLELDARYHAPRLLLEANYTLSWSQRRFDDFFDGWYSDKFDNRHRLNLSARVRLSKGVSVHAAWCYRTGNRFTMPTQMAVVPNVPDGGAAASSLQLVYEHPYNVSLPAYHRLDVGFDFRHTTRRGRERIWNVSIYNAYCHMNSLWVEVVADENGRFKAKNHGYVPILPSVSYTIKF